MRQPTRMSLAECERLLRESVISGLLMEGPLRGAEGFAWSKELLSNSEVGRKHPPQQAWL